MKKNISKRRLKIKNKRKIEDILSGIKNFTVEQKSFGDGYFVFSFEPNSVCWFKLKELPDWKFGIWLNENDNGYHIFGEHILLIDKFKPSASTLSKRTVADFEMELNKIKDTHKDWEDYLNMVEEAKIQKDKEDKINKKNLENITKFIEEQKKLFNEEKVNSFLKLVDRNTKYFSASPRYTITQFTDIEGYFGTEEDKKRTVELFDKMCNLIQYTGEYHPDSEEYFSLDSFIFESEELINPKEYEEKEKYYQRNNTYQNLLEKISEVKE